MLAVDLGAAEARATLPAPSHAAPGWFIGIDPGLSGGIAAINPSVHAVLAHPMPVLAGAIDTLGLRLLLATFRATAPIRFCAIERAVPMPGQGVVSMFTIGRNYGALLTTLELEGVPFEEVMASTWKKEVIGVAGRRADKREIKEKAFLAARRMFPTVELKQSKDGIYESLLIAEAGRRLFVVGSLGAPIASPKPRKRAITKKAPSKSTAIPVAQPRD
jgi:crossover junction endodeoxyribonuclease RuvC